MSIKWMIKKSDFYEVRKSVNKEADSKTLEQLKKEVIAILEKKDVQEYKKAIEYFEKDESKYSYLEKSVTGEWIEKAGYGVGTVRIWKGKKYKKIAQNKWVRVFDKNDRGAATSMGKYIAQVKKCSSVEELYQFCMKQRSLFQDENGVDLPIMDKLKAAIDEQNVRIGVADKMKENQKTDVAKLKEGNYSFDSFDDFKAEIDKQAGNIKGSKQPNYIGYLKQYNDKYLKDVYDAMPKDDSKVLSNGKTVKEVREQYGIKTEKKENSITTNMGKKITESELKDKIKEKEDDVKESQKMYEITLKEKGENSKYTKQALINLNTDKQSLKRWNNWLDAMKNGDIKESDFDENGNKKVAQSYWIQDKGNNRITSEDAKNRIKSNLSQIDAYNNLLKDSDKADSIKWNTKMNQLLDDNKYLMDRLNPDDRKEMESEINTKIENYLKEEKQKKDKELNISDSDINSLTDIDYLKDLQKKVVKENNRLHAEKKYDEANDMARRNYVISDRIKQLESEQEKHQNRSDAMKGNKNAYKGKAIEKAIEKYATDKQIKSTVDKISDEDFTREPSVLGGNPAMSGVFHEGGYKIATDGRILSMIKSDYPSEDEGKVKANKKYSKVVFDKRIKQAREVLQENEKYLAEAEKQGKKLDSKFVNDKMRAAKAELENAEKAKESGIIDEKFPNYKKVIPSVAGNDIEPAKGFDDFNKILQVAKVAAAYNKAKKEIATVKVGNFTFDPELLIKAVAIAEKKGLKNVNFRPSSYNPTFSPVEFSGDNGYVVIMPKEEGHYTFDVDTGDVKGNTTIAGETYLDENLNDFLNESSKENTDKSSEEKQSSNKETPMESDELKKYVMDKANEYFKANEDELSEKANAEVEKMTADECNQATQLTDKNSLSKFVDKYNQEGKTPTDKELQDLAYNVVLARVAASQWGDKHRKELAEKEQLEAKQKEEATTQKENEIKEKYHGYFDSRNGLDRARDLKSLEKKYNYDGKVMSQKEFVEQAIDNGAEIKEREVNKVDYPSRTRWNRMTGAEQDAYERKIKEAGKKTIYLVNGFEIPKNVSDYAKFYKNKKSDVKKGLFDVISLFDEEDEIIEDAKKYEDNDATNPDLFNSPAYKVSAALDSVFGCR